MQASESRAVLLRALKELSQGLQGRQAETDDREECAEIWRLLERIADYRLRLVAAQVADAETPATVRAVVEDIAARCGGALRAASVPGREAALIRVAGDLMGRVHGLLASSGSESWSRWPPRTTL